MKAVFFALMLAVTASAPALAQSVKITTHEDIVKIGHTPRDLDLVQTNPSRYGSYYIVK
jgi:hypothetical protein